MNKFVLQNVHYYASGSFKTGDIFVSNGTIVAIGTAPESVNRNEYLPIDGTARVCVPGLVNAHTHSHNILARGTLGRGSLEVLIGNIDAANKGRTPEEAYDAAVLNAVESIRGGATALVDMFTTYPLSREHIDAVGQAYKDVGIRALIAAHYTDLSSFTALPGFVDALTVETKEVIASLLQDSYVDFSILASSASKWHGANDGLITFGLAPTVPQQCSDEVLVETGRMARELGLPVHTHLAESRTETVTSQERFSQQFVEALIEFGVLGSGRSAAHGVWLGRRDLKRLSESETILVHCPSSNLRLGAGVARVPDWQELGVRWALGSDGAVSSDNLNMFTAMKLAALSSRIWGHDTSRWLSARTVLETTFSGSTQTLGSDADLRGIEEGASADLTLLSLDSSYLSPRTDIANLLVLSETGQSVSDVIVAGRFVLRDGKVTTVDEPTAITKVNKGARAMLRRNQIEWRVAESLRGLYDQVTAHTSAMPWRPYDDQEPDWSPDDLILPF